MAVKLGVNIDHVATLRQARRASHPDLSAAAAAALAAGAAGITVHLRQDRRHVQDDDVRRLAPVCRLNLEMAATPEMIAVAVREPRPHSVCLVPEHPRELTTQGGLDVAANQQRITGVVAELRAAGIEVSIFIEPDARQLEVAARTGAEFVELHTGAYALAPAGGELERLREAARVARGLGLRVNAGHGLDTTNVGAIMKLAGLEELNIGFSIVARAVFVGLDAAVREMLAAMRAGEES